MIKGLLSQFTFPAITSYDDILDNAEHLDLIPCKLIMFAKSAYHWVRIVAVHNICEALMYRVTAVAFFVLFYVSRNHVVLEHLFINYNSKQLSNPKI